MKKICAMYDADEQYAYRFMNYVNDRRLMPFEVIIFTKGALLEEYLRDSRVELLLVSENTGFCAREDLNVGRIIRLAEEENACDKGMVYKYQSTDVLVREVLRQCGDDEDGETQLSVSANTKVLGVYSPIGRCYKTTLALALAMNSSRNERTLYVNLEEFCGIPELLNATGGGLSDLIYYFRHNQGKLKSRLSEIIATTNGFDYIPVCASPEDYEDVMPEEWIEFLKYVIENGGYDVIVMDMGNVVHETWKLIALCKKVYFPVVTDETGSEKIRCFEDYLRFLARKDLLAKIEMTEIPFDEELKNGQLLGRLEWSSVGEHARRMLYG